MRTDRRNLALVLTLALGVAACGGDSTAPADGGGAGVTGTFALQTVNGVALPMVPPNHWDRLDSQSLALTGSSFSLSTVMSELDNGAVVRTYNLFESGAVTVSGSTLSFASQSGWNFTGTLSGNTITVTHDHGGMGTSTYVYAKQ